VYERLSTKGKRIVLNSIIVSAVMLFIIGFYIGKSEENKENDKNQSEPKVEDNLTYSELHKGDISENKIREDEMKGDGIEEDMPMHGQYESGNPEDFVERNDKDIVTLETYYTKEEVSEAKRIAENFVKVYYPFDGDDPMKNIEESLKYVSDDLKQKFTIQMARPIDNYYSRTYTDIHVYESLNPEEKEMRLNVRVEGEVYNSKGQKVKDEICDYQLKLVPFEDSFRIDSYYYQALN
jgi:hypothetical protein